MKRKHTILFLGLVLTSCESSFLGPSISDKDDSDASGGSAVNSGVATEPTATPTASDPTCSRSTGHDYYYVGSTVSLSYGCDVTVSSVETTSMPTYLTATSSEQTVSVSGTVASDAADATWQFQVNGSTATGTSVTTNPLASSTLSMTVGTSADTASNNDSVATINYDGVLSSLWDGDLSSGAALTLTSITTDMHGLTLQSSCSSATSPYLCQDSTTAVAASNTLDSTLNLRWKYSAFDQGTYYINLLPKLTIEEAEFTMSTATVTSTLPITTDGNVILTTNGDLSSGNNYDTQDFPFPIKVSSLSTATTPIVALTYTTSDSGSDTYFKRFTVDRTQVVTSSPYGLSQSSDVEQSDNANSTYFDMEGLSDGNFVVVGSKPSGAGETNLHYVKVTDHASNPSNGTELDLSSYSGSSNYVGSWANLTEPFTDTDSTTRMGLAYIRTNGTNTYLEVAKINPAGTNVSGIVDVALYQIQDSGGDGDEADIQVATGTLDRPTIKYKSESGTGWFYLSYRNNDEVHVAKLLASASSASYSISTASLTDDLSTVFTSGSSGNQNSDQDVDMDLGVLDGNTILGVIWREANGNNGANPNCYFRRVGTDLSTKGSAVQLSSGRCYWPSIHYNSTTGRFLVTYGQLNGSNYEIIFQEITPGTSSDSASDRLRVVALSTTRPVKIITDFYEAGHWMALAYRIRSADELKFHGFHVPGR